MHRWQVVIDAEARTTINHYSDGSTNNREAIKLRSTDHQRSSMMSGSFSCPEQLSQPCCTSCKTDRSGHCDWLKRMKPTINRFMLFIATFRQELN
tara:strand:+ start:632 stop:916 length:285 start_codon:yes stop_codon:yes gene_type:complete